MTNPVEQNMYYGEFGGQYVLDNIKVALNGVAAAYLKYRDDPAFTSELTGLLKDYAGRATPLYYATTWVGGLPQAGGPEPLRGAQAEQRAWSDPDRQANGEDLNHRRDGAGQYGVATAAKFDLKCEIYMGRLIVNAKS